MLMLLFYVGDDRYAVESRNVIEIVPRVILKTLHNAPKHMPGLFNYRNCLVPVIDMSLFIRGCPCRPYLSTRIILIDYPERQSLDSDSATTPAANDATKTQASPILGLMVERVTGTFHKQETELFDASIKVDASPYLGEMIADAQGMIQCIRVEYLLPESQQKYSLDPH